MESKNIEDKRMLLLFDHAPICCALISQTFEVLQCNTECVRLFGVADKKEFCDNFFTFSPKYQPNGDLSEQAAYQKIRDAFKEGMCHFEWTNRKKDGAILHTEVTLVHVIYNNEDTVAVYIRDKTKEKNMERLSLDSAAKLEAAMVEATAANAAKSAFLAKMSHEMRTPLNVIIGLTAMLLDDNALKNNYLGNDIRRINSAGNMLLGIISDVLDISKIEAGKLELTPVVYNTASLLSDIVALNKIRIEEKPIRFIVDIDKNLPLELFGDDLRICQVLNNLLSNAFKYTKKGNVTLRVFGRIDDDSVWLYMSVSDTGIGVKKEDIDTILDDYAQSDKINNRYIEGTGLGLSITKNLVTLMDGQIDVSSTYGQGSTFMIRVRQGYVNDDVLGSDVADSLRNFSYSDFNTQVASRLLREDMSYARVLVVDDFKANLDVTAGILRKYHMQVDCVLNGHDAIERIRSQNPVYNAIFMDQMMSDISGLETMSKIRELDCQYAKSIPIIATTADTFTGGDHDYISKGYQGFLAIPIDLFKLDALLRQWVKKDHPPSPIYDYKNIEGLNSSQALNLYDQDTSLYISVLESYMHSTPAILDELKTICDMNLENYALKAHSLKGASNCIGATEIKERANKLEFLAKAGDLSSVLMENDILINETLALIDRLRQMFSDMSSNDDKLVFNEIDKKLLAKLKLCCENYDMAGADKIIEKIMAHNYKKDAKISKWLREKIATSEFSEIVEEINKYDERCSK